jgi:hypothetical protein
VAPLAQAAALLPTLHPMRDDVLGALGRLELQVGERARSLSMSCLQTYLTISPSQNR